MRLGKTSVSHVAMAISPCGELPVLGPARNRTACVSQLLKYQPRVNEPHFGKLA
ncbi:hypothetical protein DPMN_035973 [Dreissena polymorpha]|uniref:Uncharacterized protein n=1 Tax=Dreissena polymorpha TaxID=45954 RepID=A0A9D4MAQ3_DREPO|nr:hypothetical protein DPMN_035973 [Dreissena polymorpha]